ncbi:MAG: peroxiredoxin [Burkholderiales bacterium]
MKALRVGDKVPDVPLVATTAGGPKLLSRAELFGGKKVVLFAVPGAFTPTCTAQHLPSFLANHRQIKAKGVDTIACVAVNDVFVMKAWAEAKDPDHVVLMLADGAAAWTKAAGLDWDLSSLGLGVRAQRFAMIVDDGAVSHIAVEEGAAFKVSSGEAILAVLK